MEREKEDGVAGPLFPRLRADDADRGGIRAPPRNKMALYEIFSIPSHLLRTNPPSESSGFLVPSASLNQGCGHERTAMNERNPLNLGFRRITSAADDPRPDKDHHLMDREKTKSMRNFEQTRAEKSEETRSKRDESSSPNLVASTASREGSVSSERSGSIEDTNMDEALEGSGSDAKEEPEFYKSPDDVVGLIGTKFFWKLRRAIVNQQRIFAMQVFELHRFIKVQEHLSGLPDVLLEGITPLEAPVEDPSDFLVSPQKQLFKAKAQSDLVNVNHQQKVDRSSAWPLPCYLQTTEKNDQWFLPYPPSRVPLTSCNGGPGPVPEAQQQMSIGLPVSGAEVDQLRRESRSSSNVAIPKKRVFSEKFMCISSNLLVERGSMTPLRRVSPLEGPSSSTLGSSSLTYLPWVSPLEGSCSSTPLPRVSPLKDPGSLSPLPRLPPLEESSSLTPLPRVSPLEVSSSLTPLFRVSTLESSDPLTPLPRVSPLESSAPLAHLPRVSPLEGSDPLIPLPRVSPRESSRQQSQVIRVVPHDPKSTIESAARIFQRIQKERQQYNSA